MALSVSSVGHGLGFPQLRVSHRERGWRGERLRLGVRRFSKLPLPPRSGTLWRSKSMAVLAPSSYEPPMDTGARAGRILLHQGIRPELLCLFPTGCAEAGC